MKKILLIATIYRVGERIYPIIPKLSENFSVDVLKIAQMGNKIKWYGDKDLRVVFDDKYKNYINNTYYKIPNLDNYDLILMDDDRPRNGLKEIYDKVSVPVISHQHGSGNMKNILPNLRMKDRISWDYITVFGNNEKQKYIEQKGNEFSKRILSSGIPCNDALKNYKKTNNHILVIVNFLGNRSAPFKRFDKKTFRKLGLSELQKKYDKEIVIKIKSRADHANPQSDFNYLNDILPSDLNYKIIMDTEDDNKLISDSFIVISAPSTLALKSIQKGIPTVLLKDYGQVGCFDGYQGLLNLDTQQIFSELERQYNQGKDENFVRNTVEGGLDFTSTEKYINNVRKLI